MRRSPSRGPVPARSECDATLNLNKSGRDLLLSTSMLRTDIHQHLWSEPLIEALAGRKRPPFIRRRGHVWELTAPGELASTIDVVGDVIATRGALVHLDGLDLALLSLST